MSLKINTQRLIVLDASTPRVQTSLLESGKRVGFKHADRPPLECIFELVDEILSQNKRSFADIDGYLLCRGPGSVLGERIARTFIRMQSIALNKTLQLYTYSSLEWAARCVWHERKSPFTLITEAIQSKWQFLPIRNPQDASGEPKYIDHEGLWTLPSPLYHICMRRGWPAPPEGTQALTYSIEAMPEVGLSDAWIRAEAMDSAQA